MVNLSWGYYLDFSLSLFSAFPLQTADVNLLIITFIIDKYQSRVGAVLTPVKYVRDLKT